MRAARKRGRGVDLDGGVERMLPAAVELRRKVDKAPVVVALVPKGTKSLRADEVEAIDGPGASCSARRAG